MRHFIVGEKNHCFFAFLLAMHHVAIFLESFMNKQFMALFIFYFTSQKVLFVQMKFYIIVDYIKQIIKVQLLWL